MQKRNSKNSWNDMTDAMLLQQISKYGPQSWEKIATNIEHRSGKQCRERWKNQLNPFLKKGVWSAEELWVLFIL